MSNLSDQRSISSVAEVERIIGVEDPVIRNLQITQCYHDLSAALAGRLQLCANWCTFATWASKQAGQTIRRKDLAAALENLLDSAPHMPRVVEKIVAWARKAGATQEAEQIRAAVWDALVPDPPEFKSRLLDTLFPDRGWFSRVRHFFARLFGARSLLDEAADTLVPAAREHARLIVTEQLLTITLPRGVRLRLNEDLNAPFPPNLTKLANPDLLTLLARLDPTWDSPRESGAVDWADLAERLHYIIDLFRHYQESGDLFEPPFNRAQVIELAAGRLPGGHL